jgi:hypothetical protein
LDQSKQAPFQSNNKFTGFDRNDLSSHTNQNILCLIVNPSYEVIKTIV